MPEENHQDVPPVESVEEQADSAGVDAKAGVTAGLTADRVFDIALGAMALSFEATGRTVQRLGEQARTLQDDAPAILGAWEERGRPVRAQILGKLRDGLAPISDEPRTTPTDAAPQNAEQEITALEQRVRELEVQVAGEAPVQETAPTTPQPEPTPAEAATTHSEHGNTMAFADSAYAISETDEEGERERDDLPSGHGGE